MHSIYISAPHAGEVYIAERARRGGSKLLWSRLPHAPTAPDVRVEACDVPLHIRRQAYRHLGKVAS